jgi:hypothetical protein
MSHPFPDADADDESICAARIIENALAEAIDDAIEADISGACFAIAILNHICEVLVDQFEQSPDDIAALAKLVAAAYIGAPEATVLH